MIDTLIVSDIHIGREDSSLYELFYFLIKNKCKTLVLNGDIFDQFALWKDKGEYYKKHHRGFVGNIRKILKERKTKIYYLIGNHDYLMFLLIPFGFLWGIKIRKRIKKYNVLIEHGDWITLYLKIRKFFKKSINISDDFHKNCSTFAELKKVDMIVGHSHKPKKLVGAYCDVYDVGDWVGSNSYCILSDDNVEIIK